MSHQFNGNRKVSKRNRTATSTHLSRYSGEPSGRRTQRTSASGKRSHLAGPVVTPFRPTQRR